VQTHAHKLLHLFLLHASFKLSLLCGCKSVDSVSQVVEKCSMERSYQPVHLGVFKVMQLLAEALGRWDFVIDVALGPWSSIQMRLIMLLTPCTDF
jgi:hypothetical protein